MEGSVLESLTCEQVLFHIRYGRISGIHSCCILWFVTTWQKMLPHRVSTKYLMAAKAVEEVWGIDFQHIPCPLCLFLGRTSPVNNEPYPGIPPV